VTSAGGLLPDARLFDLGGQDIVVNGIAMGSATYGSSGGLVTAPAPSVEQVFTVENPTGTAPLEVVYVDTDTTHLVASASSGAVPVGGIGGLEVELTAAVGSSNPTTTSGTVTVYTNDPASHQLDVSTTWSWVQGQATETDASTTMFFDFGDVPNGASIDRSFVFDTGKKNGKVNSLTVTNLLGSAFSHVTPNPNPFMADSFPENQSDEDVPLTFTVRSTPNATSGTFMATVSFANDDVDEPVIDALVVGYGAAAATSVLAEDFAWANQSDSWLYATDGSERALLPIPSGDDGLEFEEATGVAYMYSMLGFLSDPGFTGSTIPGYLFKVPATGRPLLITDNLPQDARNFTADIGANLSYVITPGTTANDLLQVTDAGTITTAFSDLFTLLSHVGTDSSGDIYISNTFENFVPALEKFTPTGTSLLRYTGTGGVIAFDIGSDDKIYTDLGQKFNTLGTLLGTYTGVANSRWFAADGQENILFGDDPGGASDPQSLTVEDSLGAQQSAGQLPARADQADF